MVKKSIFSLRTDRSGNSILKKNDTVAYSKFNNERDRWHKELLERLVQKDKDLECCKEGKLKLIEKKNVLESNLKCKNQEISALDDKVLFLTRELSTVKKDYVQALEEIKILKSKVHDAARKTEMIEQKKDIQNKMAKDLIKSNQLLVQEKLKCQGLEQIKLNPHKWRTMEYTDPHYFEILQQKNNFQKELLKKMELLKTKNEQLEEREAQLKALSSMLKRRPFKFTREPTEQMMECYRTILNQKERMKVMAYQVNMYESLISNQFRK